MKSFFIILISVILTAGIIGGGGYYYLHAKAESEKKVLKERLNSLRSELAELKGETSLQSSASSASADKSSAENLDASKEAVKNYLGAKKTRSLSKAKFYVTDAYYNSTNQEEFAGVSSPSMGRYTITKAEYLEAADLYKVTARVYQNLQSEEVGYSDNFYMVANQSGTFLINEVKDGDFKETN